MAKSPQFRNMIKEIAKGNVLVPILHAYLYDAVYPEFDVHFKGGSSHRPWDGWFHPSTHPTMPARKLYYYMTGDPRLIAEPLEYMGALSTTMGTAVHGFVQNCLKDHGCLLEDEVYVEHPETRSRGSMDGILELSSWGHGGLEFKCVVPQTQLNREDGTHVRADELVAGDRVLAWDMSIQRLGIRAVAQVWDNGVASVYRITTREGRTTRVTEEHPLLTTEGWKKAKEIRPGDKVRVAFGDNWHSGVKDDLRMARLVGFLTGDGCLTDRVVKFSNSNQVIVNRIRDHVQELALGVKREVPDKNDYRITGRLGVKQNAVLTRLRRDGLMGCSAQTKRLPQSIRAGGRESWIEYLSGYFDADGTVLRAPYPTLSWSSVNRALLVDCQELLGWLGIRASVVLIRGRYQGRPHISFRLMVRDAASVSIAQSLLRLSEPKAAALAGLEVKAPQQTNRTAQLGWETIKDADYVGQYPTVAIEMEGHTHITDGIVTHNTSNMQKLSGFTDNDVETFRKKWPQYYGQVQEYMRISGLRRFIVLFMGMGYPWTLKECQIDYDPAYAYQIEAKYRSVLAHLEKGIPPEPCCAPKSKEAEACFARAVCPIGAM